MSAWRPVVIVCDEPGCNAQWVIANGYGVTEGREHSSLRGWTCAKNWKDYCPDHKPPPKRRRSIWRLGAHAMVQEALREGAITKINDCECCGSKPTVGHHDDYKRPLDLRWLCAACHTAWHQENGHGANSFIEDDTP